MSFRAKDRIWKAFINGFKSNFKRFAPPFQVPIRSNHPKDKLSNFQQRKISLAAMNICRLDSAVKLIVARGGLKGAAALLYISGNATAGLTACAGGAQAP